MEIALYLSCRGHDARFHWFTHLFVGASSALVGMAVVTPRTRRPVLYPLAWIVLAPLVALAPDLLFEGGIAQAPCTFIQKMRRPGARAGSSR
ncbi:MAG: hypothetical protein M3137_04230 [Actinomycetota bacterium]|nr:hypothetical protein [Actinomycetota bacterium]